MTASRMGDSALPRSAPESPGDARSADSMARDSIAFVLAALAEPFRDDEIRVVTTAAPEGQPERLLSLPDGEPAVLWDASSGPAYAGWGAAHTVEASGVDRFHDVRVRAARLWTRLRAVTQPGTQPLPPRLFGGFSFLPSPLPEPWRGFGEATFVLPRLVYAADGDGARMAVAVTAADAEEPAELERTLAGALDALAGAGTEEPARRAGPARAIAPIDAARWSAAVESIRGRIAAGRAEKIVAAQQRELSVPGGADPVAVLRRLRTATAAEARFAFRRDGGTFLGATPERLITRRGLELRTEALAGSVDADTGERAEELLGSLKDAAEHAYVVRAIAAALGPLCEHLDYPAEPRIQRLRHVLHLQTPFVGRLARPVHVLDLVGRLHPTPAVGGTPTAEAVAWIASHEPWSRGWYAAPVGWFDGEGDGEFVVALRSALLRGERALLYAGAGIVRGSDADAELAETEVKLRTMADALGWTP